MILGDKPKQGGNHETIHTINPVPGTHHIDKLITVAGAAVVAAAGYISRRVRRYIRRILGRGSRYSNNNLKKKKTTDIKPVVFKKVTGAHIYVFYQSQTKQNLRMVMIITDKIKKSKRRQIKNEKKIIALIIGEIISAG